MAAGRDRPQRLAGTAPRPQGRLITAELRATGAGEHSLFGHQSSQSLAAPLKAPWLVVSRKFRSPGAPKLSPSMYLPPAQTCATPLTRGTGRPLPAVVSVKDTVLR
jgi:hypothetical protein